MQHYGEQCLVSQKMTRDLLVVGYVGSLVPLGSASAVISKILNHTLPAPSKSMALPGALAI